MKNKKIVNLEWYNKIRKLVKEAESLTDEEKLNIIPEAERNLYCINDWSDELEYNWEAIEELILDSTSQSEAELSICQLPKGIIELYETDENGELTGYYDWDYIIKIMESLVGEKLNIFEIWNSDYKDTIRDFVYQMPPNAECVLENLNDPIELFEILIANIWEGPDWDCPQQLRENEKLMLSFFEQCDQFEYMESCWTFLSDSLKQDKRFLEKLMELDYVREYSEILLNIEPEIYKDDDEFKIKMLTSDCCYLFRKLWDETKDLWGSVMERIDDAEFFKSCENIDEYDDLEIENYNFTEKLYNEIDKRITLAVQEGRKLKYSYYGEKTETVPLNYLRAMLMNRDRKKLKLDIKKIVHRANGGLLNLPKEIAVYNTEIEQEEEDITIMYGTDKQGRQNILYYYPSSIDKGFTRQQRVFNNKGDVVNMYRICAFEDGRVMDIDDAAVSYTYNEEGKKIYSLSQDWVMGTLYNEYDENGEIAKTTEIPASITEQDCNIIAIMKRTVSKTIGNTDNAQVEISKLMNGEIELEGEEKDDN